MKGLKWSDSSLNKIGEEQLLRGDKAVDFQIETGLKTHWSLNGTRNNIYAIKPQTLSRRLNHPWPLALTSYLGSVDGRSRALPRMYKDTANSEINYQMNWCRISSII